MAKLTRFALSAAAGAILASLAGCVTTTTNRNGVTVTVNGVNISSSIRANSAADTVQKKFIAKSVSSLQSDGSAGSISVLTDETGQNEVHVQATRTLHGSDSAETLKTLLTDVTVQADLVNGALVLSSKHPADFEKRNVSVTIDYVVTVPQRLALDLKTVSGSITVRGVRGGAKLHSGYGNIDLADVGAVLDVSTSSGSIVIDRGQDASGITAKSSYGNIYIRTFSGDINAERPAAGPLLYNRQMPRSGAPWYYNAAFGIWRHLHIQCHRRNRCIIGQRCRQNKRQSVDRSPCHAQRLWET